LLRASSLQTPVFPAKSLYDRCTIFPGQAVGRPPQAVRGQMRVPADPRRRGVADHLHGDPQQAVDSRFLLAQDW